MENLVCKACAGRDLKPVQPDLFECAACGSYSFLNSPSWNDVLQHHGQKQYCAEHRRKFIPLLEVVIGHFRLSRARWMQRHLKSKGAVLDIGCGRGLTAKALVARGFSVSVTELSAETLGDFSGPAQAIRVYTGPDALKSLKSQRFDGISLFHTLEHMDNPREVLRQVHDMLAPGGQVFLEIPLLSPLAKRFGPAWFHLDLPRHLVHFTRKGFLEAASAVGLKVCEMETYSWEFSAPSLFLSLTERIFPGSHLYEKSQITSSSSVWRWVANGVIVVGSSICLIPALILAALNQGDILRVRLVAA